MSVAFRRESDEEHLEPKFEQPIAPGPNLVTARGLRLLGERVTEIEAAVAAETDEEARKLLLRDLRYWHTRQTTAELAPSPEEDEVGIGSRVRVRMNGIERVIAIVGGDEAEPGEDRLAFSAPLARALMGAAVGETVAFADKADAIEVLAIDKDDG
jgi:transcription elongation GreA/GreB family factor